MNEGMHWHPAFSSQLLRRGMAGGAVGGIGNYFCSFQVWEEAIIRTSATLSEVLFVLCKIERTGSGDGLMHQQKWMKPATRL